MARMHRPYNTKTTLTTFCVTRNRSTAISAEMMIAATITSPWTWTDQVLAAGKAKPMKASTIVPVATITRTPAMHPMIHQPNDAGPADWMTAALVMNSTIATKIATMSKVESTLGRIPPATRSEMS